MTDPIQHLRALQSAAYFIAYPVRYHNASYSIIDSADDIICDSISEVNGRLIVAAINALPALLAVAEAARIVLKNNQGPCDLVVYVRDMIALSNALARLTPTAPTTGAGDAK